MSDYPNSPGHRRVPTSIKAANALAPKLGRLHRLLEVTIRAAGPIGLTADELAARVGFDRWELRPRASELRAKGVIRDSGLRRPTVTGRSAIVWVVA